MSKKPFTSSPNSYWLYGQHSCLAALSNKERIIKRLMVTKNTAPLLKNISLPIQPFVCEPHAIERVLPKDAVHQGIAIEVEPLEDKDVEDLIPMSPLIILDQVTDPHNVGAIIRSAAALGGKGIILTERNSAPDNGTLAKAASGGLEIIPIARVTNLAQTMNTLKKAGYWCIGLDGDGEENITRFNAPEKIALILGAEGTGMRRLTRENCDILAHIPISENMESLNVSNAAAIALFCLMQGNKN